MRALALLAAPLLVSISFLACANNTNGDDDQTTSGPTPVGTQGTTSGQGSTTQLAGRDGGIQPPVEPDVDLDTISMGWEGAARSYILARPRGYDPNLSYPLVVALHGNPSTKEALRKQAPFELGSKREAFIVYPDAAGGGWDLVSPPETNKDMGWIRALPGEIAKTANIDQSRVYGFGFSGGAFFVSQMGCAFGDVFRAISVNAGGAPDGSQSGWEKKANRCYVCPGGPIPTLVVHGMNDGTVVRASGAFAAKCAAETNNCATSDVKSPSSPAECTKADGCGSPTELCLVQGLGHMPWAQSFAKSWSFFQSAP